MKKILVVLAFMMVTSLGAEAHGLYNNHVTISVQTFYDELSPYGDWIYTPEYGYAWRPYIDCAEDFRPYATRGNWANTDLGWNWVSDYRWGWATFHYGRWFFDDYLGWMWIPGYEWAPAWVTWGSYDGCWAWAPMGPDFRANGNTNRYAPAFWWTFVPFHHFGSNNWYSYVYNQPVYITNITYITNVYTVGNYPYNNGNWYYGPRVRDVERHLNTRVRKMEVVDADKPDNLNACNGRVSVYRPSVSNDRGNVQPKTYRVAATPMKNARTEQKNREATGRGNNRAGNAGNLTRTSTDNKMSQGYRNEVNHKTTARPSNERFPTRSGSTRPGNN